MIAYITVGADDIAHAKQFYSAFLPALGYGLQESPEGLIPTAQLIDLYPFSICD